MRNPGLRLKVIVFLWKVGTNCSFLRATKFEVSKTAEDTLRLRHERLGYNNKIDILKSSKQTGSSSFLDGEDECDVCNSKSET